MGVSDGIRSRKRARSGSLPTHILHGFAGDSGSIGPDRRRFRSRSSGRIETALEGQHGSKSGGGGGGSRRQRAAAAAASAAAVQGGAKSPAAAGPTRKQSTNTRSANRRQNSGMDPRLPTFGIDIPESRIYMVDTTERVEAAGAILARSVVMSIDTETQPSFTAGEWHPTSLLQIATRWVTLRHLSRARGGGGNAKGVFAGVIALSVRDRQWTQTRKRGFLFLQKRGFLSFLPALSRLTNVSCSCEGWGVFHLLRRLQVWLDLNMSS